MEEHHTLKILNSLQITLTGFLNALLRGFKILNMLIITPFICLVLVSIFRIEDRTAEIELPYCSSASAKDKDQVLPGSFPKSTHM